MTERADLPVRSSADGSDPREVDRLARAVRRGAVRRVALLERLATAVDQPVVALVAPAGFGKTTLLAQWAATGRRPVAWLTVDEGHNDPVLLFRDLASAIAQHDRVDPVVFDALSSPGLSAYGLAARLLSAFVDGAAPLLVVIDDAHELTDRPALDSLGAFVSRLPQGCQVAIAGRRLISIPWARLRAQDSLLELTAADLAMDASEAAMLARELEAPLSREAVEDLVRTSGGWPAIVYLGARAAAHVHAPRAAASTGRSQDMADYLRAEVLDQYSEDEVTFLLGTAVLDRLDGPTCDAVLDRTDSAGILAGFVRSTLFVEERGGWYRTHALLRDFLLAELRRRQPGRVASLHARAAAWYERIGDIDAAVDHAFAGDDVDHAAVLVGRVALPYHWSGRRATVRSWILRFGDARLQERPWLAVLGAMEEAGIGDVAATNHLRDLVERGSFEERPPDGTASFESGRAMLRALMCTDGPADMLVNASRATALESATSPWRDLALWAVANAHLIVGEADRADATLADAAAVARANRNFGTWQCALAQRALLAIDRGDWAVAAAHAAEAEAIIADAHLDGYQITAPALAALARLAAWRGDIEAARRHLAAAVQLRAQLTATIPWLNVTALLAIARAYLSIGDPAGARTLLVHASDVLRLRPDLGVLPDQLAALRTQIAALPVSLGGASTLTTAELRVLAFLPLYLSFKEIGDRLGVRASTVHTHATAIYGKLGASSRSEAVELAIGAGLLEGLPAWSSTSPIAVEAPRSQA